MKDIYDLVIIGGGPAGLTAAIYARRANLNVLLIEESSDGGKLAKIHQIDNYPGIQTISGFDLAKQLIDHAKKYETKMINGKVIKIKNNNVYLANGDSYLAKAILVATGSKQRKLDIPNSLEYEGKGISYCATCDGFFFRNKDVAVIGDSSQALEESLYLANIVSKLTIINRHQDITGEETLAQLVKNNEKIEVINSSIPVNLIINDNKITGLTIMDVDSNKKKDIPCVGIFPYIAFNPGTVFLDSSILNTSGFIKTKPDMSTSIEGIYAAGDCIEKDLRQVVTACADGAIAATSIIKYLKK